MGVFSINESHFNIGDLPEVEMNENYSTGTDMAIALVEARENEFAVLQAGIKQDLVAAMCEDYDERLAINEATAGGVMAKVKEILKKLLEKLKGLFHAFMAKMNSFFMDSNEFFKKYSAEIAKKPLRDFEIKARKFDRTKFDTKLIEQDINITLDITKDNYFDTDEKYRDKIEKDKIAEVVIDKIFTAEAKNAMDIDDDFGNVAKEIEDYVFEDAEKHDNLSGATIVTSDWIGKLLSEKKFISDIEKVNKATEKAIAKAIKAVDKDLTKIAGTIGNDKTYDTGDYGLRISQDVDDKSSLSYVNKTSNSDKSNNDTSKYGIVTSTSDATKQKMIRKTSYLQVYVSAVQDCMIKAQNARLACAKKAVAQAKKIFAAAVAYNPKKEEGYEFYTAVGEAAEFEAMMAME